MQATVWVLGVLNNASTLYDLTTVSCLHLASEHHAYQCTCYVATSLPLSYHCHARKILVPGVCRILSHCLLTPLNPQKQRVQIV
jgi:hypothetical protein